MTETILTGKKIEKFSQKNVPANFGFIDAKIPGFFKYFLMRYCPGDAGNREGQYKQVGDLLG